MEEKEPMHKKQADLETNTFTHTGIPYIHKVFFFPLKTKQSKVPGTHMREKDQEPEMLSLFSDGHLLKGGSFL